jgi:hypothetical protein
MQASKIKVKSIYAVRAADEVGLNRFNVTAVVQRRVDNTGSPHDYKSSVEGFVVEDNDGVAVKDLKVIRLDPDKILGPFEEFAELDNRRKAELAAATQKATEFDETNLELRRLLYQLVGEPIPNDQRDWKQLFRYTGSTLSISSDAVEPLVKALKAMLRQRDAA